MSAIRDWECLAHGVFEARTLSAKHVPKCPKGCSRGLVKLVFLTMPGTVSDRTRTSDRLVREAADLQGLSDISTSPSRPGGSVAHRNRMRGPRGRQDLQYPAQFSARSGGTIPFHGGLTVENLGAQGFTAENNGLRAIGLGHAYDKTEWKTDKETGKVRHEGAPPIITTIPTGGTGVSIERVKDKPK